MTHFERLGLPGRFSVDPEAVERAYLTRSREVHPDYHGLADPDRQRESVEATAALNEAYLTLRDPFRRAEYLLTLLGGPSAQAEKNLDQSFLMEMMDLREQIEEAKAGHTGLDDLRSRVSDRLDQIVSEIDRRFEQAGPGDVPSDARVRIRRSLNAAKTVRSLLRELDEE
ncbi:MAG: Fe-S protein assembly co-chaperone HscB [Gemmataceae bacterium]